MDKCHNLVKGRENVPFCQAMVPSGSCVSESKPTAVRSSKCHLHKKLASHIKLKDLSEIDCIFYLLA